MESKLITADSWFRMDFNRFRTRYLLRLRERFHIVDGKLSEVMEPVPAFVNRGAWLVRCPSCRGAEYAWEEGFFFCCSCKNSYMGHDYRRLVFPEDRRKIEDLLVVRPLNNRNWNLGESVADLERENKEHAAELLLGAKGG